MFLYTMINLLSEIGLCGLHVYYHDNFTMKEKILKLDYTKNNYS